MSDDVDIVDHLRSGVDNVEIGPNVEVGGLLMTMREAADEIIMLRKLVTRYCDKSRMGTIEPMNLQQAADRAFQFDETKLHFPGEVPSPCGKGCQYDSKRKMCASCGRTLEEIGNWSRYTTKQKLAVLERLKND